MEKDGFLSSEPEKIYKDNSMQTDDNGSKSRSYKDVLSFFVNYNMINDSTQTNNEEVRKFKEDSMQTEDLKTHKDNSTQTNTISKDNRNTN